MTDDMKRICESCGSHSFAQGKLDGYATIRPIDKIFNNGSPLIVTFCKECGEVASMKVKNPHKF